MKTIFDPGAVADHAAMYQAQIVPELFPRERRMMVEQWHPEDQEAYCGGVYVKK